MQNLAFAICFLLVFSCKNLNKKTDVLAEEQTETTPSITPELEQDPEDLIGEWIFIDIESGAATRATLRFMSEVKLIGNDGCNQFFGHYSAIGSGINFQAISSTKKICPDIPDTKIITSLDQISSYNIENDTLTFLGIGESLFHLKRK
jgi:heat shock protein HslJ